MGTTALVLILEGSVGGFIMNFFLLSSVISLSLAAPAPEAEAKAGLLHPVLTHHVAPLAVVPAKQLQWPGITAPGVDSTCFGCRSAVVVGRKKREAEAEADAEAEAALVHPVLAHHVAPLAVVPAKQLQWPGITAPGVDSTCFGCRHAVVVGRKRREAEAVADAEAEATADAEPVAEAAAAPFYPLAVAPHFPYHVPAVALRSSGYATVNNAGVSYSTGVNAVHVLPLGRRRREAEAEAAADAEAEAEAKVEALGVAPVTSLNGYIHNLGSGNSYAAISSGPSLPFVHAVAPFPYPYLG